MKYFLLIIFPFLCNAQIKKTTDSLQSSKTTADTKRQLNPDFSQISNGFVTVKGIKVPFKTTLGTIPVWDENGKIIASCFYTYYERSDIKDKAKRPIIFSFNGGPGSASVWMHIAYTGPKLLNIDDEGYPIQPYGYKENPNSILDVADIVYIDPVNTGFSRIMDANTPKTTFFGVKADIKYLSEWCNTFLNRVGRWSSPKFLIGESYGTNRVSGMALELQQNQWMYLNGIVLVSPTDLGIKRDLSTSSALRLPYFAAVAWYHKALADDLQKKDLETILPEIEEYTVNTLLPTMAKGSTLSDLEKNTIAQKMSYYSGLSKSFILQNNLKIEEDLFWKELLREKGFTVGRLDSRYLGIDSKAGGENPEYNAELDSWLHSFTPAINMYLREELNFKTDLKYNMFGPVHPWQRDDINLAEELRKAMAANPYLNVLTQSGYYDGACDYFNAKYNLWQLDPSGKMNNRLFWKGYRSGHMMYLRKEDLQKANDDLREFINKSLPKTNQAAKY